MMSPDVLGLEMCKILEAVQDVPGSAQPSYRNATVSLLTRKGLAFDRYQRLKRRHLLMKCTQGQDDSQIMNRAEDLLVGYIAANFAEKEGGFPLELMEEYGVNPFPLFLQNPATSNLELEFDTSRLNKDISDIFLNDSTITCPLVYMAESMHELQHVVGVQFTLYSMQESKTFTWDEFLGLGYIDPQGQDIGPLIEFKNIRFEGEGLEHFLLPTDAFMERVFSRYEFSDIKN